MTRIIAGAARGRRLAVPPAGTRPTSERAREALFNSLRSLCDLDGARVLDLFAGSGAVGLEALSRGAAEVTFVESDRRAGEVLRRNIDTVGLSGAVLLRRPVAAVLAAPPAPPEQPFDLVFADPPYALADGPLAALLTPLAEGWLAAGAVVVVERAARGTPPPWPAGVIPVMNRRYGEGILWYGRAR
jgi:16S rRNA (guanine966-N2)-methyltransferase